jgi:leader peptidase (prepilin peptidase)/N-methyltransferase
VVVDLMWAAFGVLLGPVIASVGMRAACGQRMLPALRQPLRLGDGPVACALVTASTLFVLSCRFAGTPGHLAWCWFGVTGIQLVLIDLVCQRIPRPVVSMMFVGGLVLLAEASSRQGDLSSLVRGLMAVVLVFGCALLLAVAVAPSLGAGDVMLLGVTSLYLGWSGWSTLVVGLTCALVAAALVALLLVLSRRLGPRDPIALAPAIIGGALIALILP